MRSSFFITAMAVTCCFVDLIYNMVITDDYLEVFYSIITSFQKELSPQRFSEESSRNFQENLSTEQLKAAASV